MEELIDKLERTKSEIQRLLKEMGLSNYYNESEIEKEYLDPFTDTSNSYKFSLTYIDRIILANR